MKTNKEVLDESFFKHKSFTDIQAQKMKDLQYSPIDSKGSSAETGFGSQTNGSVNKPFAVTDMDEVRKRLIGTFGATIGINTIKNMANKSVKTFPIIVSEDVEPDTAVMLKKLLEEQYAEYLELTISNSVIDLSAYKTGDENGNIAIQAIDKLSGTDFGSQRIARAANTGNLTADDMLKNYSFYNLIRQESQDLKTGDKLIDALLENALVVSPDRVKDAAEYITESLINEDIPASERGTAYVPNRGNNDFNIHHEYNRNDNKKYETLLGALHKELGFDSADNVDQIKINRFENTMDAARGLQGSDIKIKDPIYTRLTNSGMVVHSDQLRTALDKTIGETLLMPENKPLKDRFEKATFLLQSNMISGGEYIAYLTMRLGIPVDVKTRQQLVSTFKTSDVRDFSNSNLKLGNGDLSNAINQNKSFISNSVKHIASIHIRDVLKASVGGILSGLGIAGGATAFNMISGGSANVGTALGTALIAGTVLNPLVLGAIGGTIVGGSILIAKIIKNRKENKKNASRIQGWERVEALIDEMDRARAETIKNYKDIKSSNDEISADNKIHDQDYLDKEKATPISDFMKFNKDMSATIAARNDFANINNIDDILDDYTKSFNIMVKENNFVIPDMKIIYEYSKENLSDILDESISLIEGLSEDKEYRAELLEKFTVSTSNPYEMTDIKKKFKKLEVPDDILVTPNLSARAEYAYGSVEYEKKDLKERKYNTPLIMKVTFNERLSDGTYSDNELVAVIGILGVITRVPSEEMKYILSSNAKGITVRGMLMGDDKVGNIVTDLIGIDKIKKDAENLPISGDMWNNLEKIARLAAVNKLAGKASDNIANAHLVFSQKEIDDVRDDTGADYLKDKKLVADLMKRYSAFTVMVANDISQKIYIFDDIDAISWDVVPYNSLRGKDTGDQLSALASVLQSNRR